MIDLPHFEDKKELFKFLKENKKTLIAQKKATLKHADAIYNVSESPIHATKSVNKVENKDILEVKSIINTTNVFDSHSDVHINGIWNKTVKENKQPFLLQEHDLSYKGVISDEVKASVKTYTFKELGYNSNLTTEALEFNSIIKRKDNEFMFDKYADNKVTNHSVGMQYVKVELAVNDDSEDYAEEKAVYDKYINTIINKQDAENNGFFWAVLEAKMIEGSAVLIGSNRITPTVEVKSEPSNDTRKHIEPSNDTQNKVTIFNFN